MRGTRVEWTAQILNPGEYSKLPDGTWYAAAPRPDFHANLGKHDVVEHDDGTITVSPSILITRHDGTTWHGYLERGTWREA